MGDKKGIQYGRMWYNERGKNARRNKRESWEMRKSERGKVVVHAHDRKTKTGKIVRVKGYLRKK